MNKMDWATLIIYLYGLPTSSLVPATDTGIGISGLDYMQRDKVHIWDANRTGEQWLA